MIGMSDLPSPVNRCRGCPHVIILQGFLLLLTNLFIEGRFKQKVQKMCGIRASRASASFLIPLHVALMLHGGFATPWKSLQMPVSMSRNLVQHEASISN
jgi:hypothetical protein